MQQQLILYTIILKYLLIESQTSTSLDGPIKLNFYYSSVEPSQTRSIQVTTSLYPKNNVKNYYFLITDVIDDKRLLVRAINCTNYRSVRGYCERNFKSLYIFLSNEMLPEEYVLRIENDPSPLTTLLNQLSYKSFDGKNFNLTCIFVDLDGNHWGKPTPPYEDQLSKTTLIGIIFLSICIVLVFVFCFGWFGIIYYRRFREYRMKKKLHQELAQSTQQMLDKSPIIIYDPTNRDQDQTDDEPMCAICLELFKSKEKIRKLVCSHYFHMKCIDPWLLSHQSCPLCNRNILRNSIPTISSSIMTTINERNNDESTSITHNDNNQTIQAQN